MPPFIPLAFITTAKGWCRNMNIKSADTESFKEHSQFTSLEEFNRHIEMWMVVHKKEFSKGELVGLKRLVRFAAKFPGVCNAKIGTILKAIHENYNGQGISRSTFKRMIQKAMKIGIFTVYETERKNGSQSSNLYVFNRFPQNEPPKIEKVNHLETSNLSETKQNNITTRNDAELDFTYTNDRVPKPFVILAKSFFQDAKTIEEFWKMTNIAAYRGNREKEQGTLLDLSIDSFKQMIRKCKLHKVHNPIAYYYWILTKKMDELYFEELYELESDSNMEYNVSDNHPIDSSLALMRELLF
jgi:N-acetylglutamate synthase-like GNAT family acetyltransferase